MDTELSLISRELMRARFPEDIFGDLEGDVLEIRDGAKAIFRRLAKATHPDLQPEVEKAEARKAFEALNFFYQEAQEKIRNGTYGQKEKITPITIASKRGEYVISECLFSGDVSEIYAAKFPEGLAAAGQTLLKIVREPEDNDLMTNEVKIIQRLLAKDKKADEAFFPYLPTIMESFMVTAPGTPGGRMASAIIIPDGFYSLVEVVEAYPSGVDPKDMAWMWNRILEILGYCHRKGVIHGGVTPGHFLIHPVSHGGILIGWTGSALGLERSKRWIRLMSADWEEMYPPEVMAKKEPTPATDLYLSAMTMIKMLGGDGKKREMPRGVPREIADILMLCINVDPGRRPQDAWEVREKFDRILKRVFGPRAYHSFLMPPRGK